jgi:hypothetical protein
MKIFFWALFGITLVLYGGTVRAQETQGRQLVDADPVNALTVVVGHSVPAQFTFHIKPGYHINSRVPATPELIPTQLTFSPPEDLVIAKVQYPAGVLTSFPFDPTEKLSVYSGAITIRAAVLTQPKAGAGRYTVHAELKYQACDNNACYPPKRLPIAFDVRIASGNSKIRKARPTATSPHIHN